MLNPVNLDVKPVAMADRVPMTNAQRIARGLGPNRPRFRSSARLAPRASSLPDPNPNRCTTVAGHIRVTGTGIETNSFVSRNPNPFGEYGITEGTGDALLVQYIDCMVAMGSLDLVTLNGIADFTYLGGITGYASSSGDLARGSDNYVYLGGTTQIAPNARPASGANSFTFTTGEHEDIESAIWRINASTGAITAHWVNPDGSLPTTTIAYYAPENFLLLTGDDAAFARTYGTTPVVTLTFVEA
ncbi:uncharacterized protein LAESUDRAFT_655174 [Laetiporus sulphureus 93-53]|uniref:Uncharacterized protein n=1 Tax=Laetiporus sulphureus 93-53 TaxID=1314785 RepID=A0A165DVA4_9APHY|nr:uncharacterized protein LAESUDRAFT_655174 [Laetiporus sulphureus 93-53]KZT05696.1 hypothetical protein LAESUDRAFT_655174 [Laetiporus sulphureus 93-53]